ncbi:heat-shock protein [Hanstruepera neustonica]|uniref:Heat-shock protein n=1 Tax=Hanstruepera neustonica TaxID=1445657 RepID=A0A2K1DYK6_9FLAO|nr:Hsp20/alpha crystallin family protein [Hanstruepera neustonica]PNQ73101.1 heat-shock protein [Hanstruepera neustonica]
MNNLVTMPKNGNRLAKKENVTGLPSFSSWLDNFFDTDLGTGLLSNFNTGMTLPAVNIKEDNENYHLDVAVPGLKKGDFEVEVDNDILTISAHTKTKNEVDEENYTRREFGYSSFKRTFTLPDTVESENIKAGYEDGILSVHIPKREEAKRKPAKRIDIS